MTEPQTPEGKELLALVERYRAALNGIETIAGRHDEWEILRIARAVLYPENMTAARNDAENEVERLRRERDHLTEMLKGEAIYSDLEARAKVERLREALELVVASMDEGDEPLYEAARGARATLDGLSEAGPPEPGEDYPLPYQDPERGESGWTGELSSSTEPPLDPERGECPTCGQTEGRGLVAHTFGPWKPCPDAFHDPSGVLDGYNRTVDNPERGECRHHRLRSYSDQAMGDGEYCADCDEIWPDPPERFDSVEEMFDALDSDPERGECP